MALKTALSKQFGTRAEVSFERDTKFAAVAVCFVGTGTEAQVLMIHRAEHENDPWSGHMAFPGGKQDHGDKTVLNTAIRETKEEVGIDLKAHGQFIGQLQPIQAMKSGQKLPMFISPHIFHMEKPHPITIEESEVQNGFYIPLSFFLDAQNLKTGDFTTFHGPIDLPYFDFHAQKIWGLSFYILRELLLDLGGAGDWFAPIQKSKVQEAMEALKIHVPPYRK
jgi:8-oxo-dGTP pyrophosphatase MutT (NUDIX family)